MISDVVAQHGALDILVNNAGICPMVELFDITEELWDRVHRVESARRLLLHAGRRASDARQEDKGADYLHELDFRRVRNANADPLCAHKGRHQHDREILAAVLGPHGITINAVAPGDIATDIAREWDEANPEEIQRYIERCPVRRRGRPEDIANVVAFLASPEAEFITGSVYMADGGITSTL